MAKFKCVHSDCIYEWLDEETVKNMQAHAEYTEVVQTLPTKDAEAGVKAPTKKQVKE